MDLGATICTPRRPACGLCPLRPDCAGLAQGLAAVLPYRQERAKRPLHRGVAFVALREDGAVLLRQRPLHGLLGGMLETPSSPWERSLPDKDQVFGHAPLAGEWREVPGLVEHTFTHFHLELAVYRAEVGIDAALTEAAAPEHCRWIHVRELHRAALPSVMRKVLAHALAQETRRGRPTRQVPIDAAAARARRRSA